MQHSVGALGAHTLCCIQHQSWLLCLSTRKHDASVQRLLLLAQAAERDWLMTLKPGQCDSAWCLLQGMGAFECMQVLPPAARERLARISAVELVWSVHLWLSKRHRWAWARHRCCWLLHERAVGAHGAPQPDSGCLLEYLHSDEPHNWEHGTRTGAAGGRAGAPGAGRALQAC